jgi:hypothetical protein
MKFALILASLISSSAFAQQTSTFVDCGDFRLQHISNSYLRIKTETFLIPDIAAELSEGGYRQVQFQMTSDSVNYIVKDYEINGATAQVTISSFAGQGDEAVLQLIKSGQTVATKRCSLVK